MSSRRSVALLFALGLILGGCKYVEEYNPFDKDESAATAAAEEEATPVDPEDAVGAPTSAPPEASSAPVDPADQVAAAGEAAPAPTAATMYTTYNMWYERTDRLYAINYHIGTFLPAGTPVKNIGISQRRFRKQSITFTTVEQNITFTVEFQPKFHPGKTIQDYRNMMFTDKPLEELTAGLSQLELDSIKLGQLNVGMSKRAVLIAYGYPPEHATLSLDRSPWTYWTNRFTSKQIHFDENGRTMAPPAGGGL